MTAVNYPETRLQEIRDDILSQTRSDKLKAVTTALDKFIDALDKPQ